MEELLKIYISELRNKILLKGIKNKTEKQIFFQTFKYFDNNTSGYCNLDNFIKVNQKIGVIMHNPEELQKIFFYFDSNNEGTINYKDFIDVIFKPSEPNQNISNRNNKKNTTITNSSSGGSGSKNYSQTNYYSSYNNKEKNIFKLNNTNSNIGSSNNSIPPYKKPFFDKIVNNLLNSEIGPSLSLLSLHQGFILGDNNFMNQITIEEFIKIINDNKIKLSISDIQMLFHSYELNNDGFFYYEEMFNDLINIYWNNQRKRISQRKSEKLIDELNKEGGLKISLLQNIIFIPKNYENFFHEKLDIYDANEYYIELMKKYVGLKRILNCPRDADLTLEDLEEIMKYISFGIQNNEDFNKAINYIFSNKKKEYEVNENSNFEEKKDNNYKKNINSENPSQNNKKKQDFRKQNNINNNINKLNNINNNTNIMNNNNINKIINNDNNNNKFEDYLSLFRNYFLNYGIITFLNILKTFQYYDNGSKQINKNDFTKILKDFKINISSNIIEQIYHIYDKNNANMSLNYIVFISQLIDKFVNNNIINLINNIYDKVNIYCLNYSGKNMNLDFFKNVFNVKNNYFFKEPKECLNNILIIFERFHYDFYEKYHDEFDDIKNKKDINKIMNENIIQINRDEFVWFYKFLNFFIENEIVFKMVILNDWKNILNLSNNNNNKNNIKNQNINNNLNYDNNNFPYINYQKYNINNEDYNSNNNINNEDYNSNNNIINNNIIKQTPILMAKTNNNEKEYNNNNKNEILIKFNKLTKNNTISNDIQNNINHKDEIQIKELEEQNNNNQHENININNFKEDSKINNINQKEDVLQKIITKLKKRGIRGAMNLHKQFILTCRDLSNIPFEEFLKVMSYQRLTLSNEEYKHLFLLFSDEDNKNNLNFPKFIRAFKRVLNDKRLSAIENIFTKLDINGNDNVSIDDVKMKFNAKEHISVLKGEKDEEEILCEFLDCFDLNYNILITKDNPEENNNMVNFEEFANFYEYVSFLYDNDDEFIELINNSWKN